MTYNIIDSFTDFEGVAHQFVMVAVKVNLKYKGYKEYPIVFKIDNDNMEDWGCVRTGLCIGVSICNPLDKFDEKIGVLKATAKAKGSIPVLYASFSGQLGEQIIQTYLKQEATYLKEHPEKYIKGYEEAKKRFLKQQEINNLKENLTNTEKVILENLQKNPAYLDNIKKYMEYKCEK